MVAVNPRGRWKRPTLSRQGSVLDLTRQEVHARLPNEAGDKEINRAVIDLIGRSHLMDTSVVQHGDAVGHRHCLDLVVGHVHERSPKRSVDSQKLRAHGNSQLEVEIGKGLIHEVDPAARVAAASRTRSAPECDTLLLAARKLGWQAIELVLDLQQSRHFLNLVPDRVRVDLARPQWRGDEVKDRLPRIERVRLGRPSLRFVRQEEPLRRVGHRRGSSRCRASQGLR